MKPDRIVFEGGSTLVRGGLVAFVVGLAGLIMGGSANPRQAFFSYLSAYVTVVSLALGALIFLMIVHAMNAKWPTAIRRIPEGITTVLPLLALGFVPLAFGLRSLYPWTAPEAIRDHEMRHLLEHKAPYLNTPSFHVRAFVYFVIWIGVAFFLRRWSLVADKEPVPAGVRDPRFRALSALGLPPVAFALTFASFDWLMSLTPMWYSTMFGVRWFAGGFLGALALTVVFTWGAQQAGMLGRVSSSHYYALGRLLLAFTIFWAYAAFFELFLIWIVDRPMEASFYAVRIRGAWRPYTIALGIGHFALPFFMLLPYRIKRRPVLLASVAIWLVVTHWLDMQWLVMPVARPEGPMIHPLDLAALLCIGGASLAFGIFRMRGAPIVPKNDPALEAAYRYESL
ncbi:hypothetical protein [Polyangium aurulentum]|uniref:hypothetical protein n=1 Tax=Polyangium aurulentum TaxID=2567896 RepID=UPI0010AE0B91|nr:hypothetical protein [Polyangium aurulentum]UQA54573.1 hypothetical protein E8A73_024695 [Polyangium aurulentum]